ncbi:MAG: Tat pathway signal protein [Atopobiaceae bacterium]
MQFQRKQPHNITRRGLIRGLAVGASATAAVSVLAGCTHAGDEETPEPTVVSADSATNVLETYEEADLALEEAASWTLPLGCVLKPSEGSYLAVLQAGASASPMVKGCAFSTQTGELKEVVSKPLAQNTTTVIYDVACSDEVYAWIEYNYLDKSWSFYASALDGGSLSGSTTTLGQADANWDPPKFVCTADTVIWQLMPSTSGSKATEHSVAYLWKVGQSSAQAVVESPGRFATEPTVSQDQVILAPRVRADQGVYYGVGAYSLKDNLATITDQLVMPRSVRPFHAVRIGDKFVISVEANYSGDDLLSGMGTYISTGNDSFLQLSREPAAQVAGKDGVFIVKSRASYFVLDTNASTYSILAAANRCIDYGEFPARTGTTDTFVTFATVKDEQTGYPTAVTVRAFTL